MLLATSLGKTTADHVANCDDRHVEPSLRRCEDITMAARRLDHRRRDQNYGDNRKEGEELGCLERCLGFRRETTDGVICGGRKIVGTAVRDVRHLGALAGHWYVTSTLHTTHHS